MIRTLKLTAVALSVALAACSGESGGAGGDASNEASSANQAADEGSGASEARGATLPTDAAGFANAVAAADLYEIQSSALAREKAVSADLRGFAQRLEREHGQSAAGLRAAAAAAGISITPELDAEKQAMMAELQAASGADFDGKYIDQQRLAHQKTLMLLQNYAGAGDNEALKAHADKARAMVEGHSDVLNYMRK